MKRSYTVNLLGASVLLLTSVGLAVSHEVKETDVANLSPVEEAVKTATIQFP